MKMEAFIRAATEFVFQQDEPQPADVILVPGSVCAELGEAAAALYHRGYAPWVLPSGRYSITAGRLAAIPEKVRKRYPGQADTEWAFLRHVLTANGVPDTAILREDQATYTWENAQFSRQVTDQAGIAVRRALICCKPVHARRALLYYQAAYPDTELLAVPVSIPGRNRDDWWRTPEGRAAVLGEIRRLGSQINEVLEDAMGDE